MKTFLKTDKLARYESDEFVDRKREEENEKEGKDALEYTSKTPR